jgi:hypothetical protein
VSQGYQQTFRIEPVACDFDDFHPHTDVGAIMQSAKDMSYLGAVLADKAAEQSLDAALHRL